MRFPSPLNRDSRALVVAPSGPFDIELAKRGIARLAPHLSVDFPSGLGERPTGFLAASDGERLSELQAALDDEEHDVILLARGGYGLTRILPKLDFARFERRPKWFVGFSDGTALELTLSRRRIGSLHGPNATTLATAREEDIAALLALLRGESITAPIGRQSFALEGPLFGGNLTMLFTEAASGRLEIPEGSLLFLEDVTETSYRIDRMLTALLDGGYLERVRGFLLGEFVGCSPGKFGVDARDVLRERLGTLGVPIVEDIPFGHGSRNLPLVQGGTARLDGSRGTFEYGPF